MKNNKSIKLLYITSLSGKRINNFMLSSIIAARNLNFEYHIASNQSMATKFYFDDCKRLGIKPIHINFHRNPFNPINIFAFLKLIKLIKKNEYDIIHANTPIGGLLGRIAAKINRKKNVIYMAHGFHFYEGAPLLNWLIYFPVEKLLSRWTDTLITINLEDYNLSKKLYAKNNIKINGVGISLSSFENSENSANNIRSCLKISKSCKVLISVGELNNNKNHKVIIKALAKVTSEFVYLICGTGPKLFELKKFSKELGVENKIKFLGFRNDIYKLLKISNLFVFPSKREGLSIALMEAMAMGLPVICSDIRGNNDLILNNRGGFLIKNDDEQIYAEKINQLLMNDALCKEMGEYNKRKIREYDISKIVNSFENVYSLVLKR